MLRDGYRGRALRPTALAARIARAGAVGALAVQAIDGGDESFVSAKVFFHGRDIDNAEREFH